MTTDADRPPIDRAHSLMSGLDQAPAMTTETGSRLGRFFGRRRTYLVDAGFQMRSAIVAVLGMIFLVVFSIVLFRLLGAETARELARKAPLLANGAPAGDDRTVLTLIAVGILFVAAVFVIEILETHKTAGVVLKVTRGLRDIQAGLWGSRVSLRKHDNFKEMEEAFNAATRALRERVEDDLHGLQALEAQIRLAGREMENGNREGALVLLRQIGGEIQSLRERRRNLLRAPSGSSDAPKSS